MLNHWTVQRVHPAPEAVPNGIALKASFIPRFSLPALGVSVPTDWALANGTVRPAIEAATEAVAIATVRWNIRRVCVDLVTCEISS
ncbi:MAG: hypothetical protein EXR45_00335 [Chloroflexi bacterium]|nr:hypothetical protein [Chloroflexota bacterium]